MSSADWAVIVWTIQAIIGVLFSGTMITTRWRSLGRLYASSGNGDREYRISLARQDIRRSVVRHLAFAAAFTIGAAFLMLEHTDWIDQPPRWLPEHWVWLLSTLMTLLTINEVTDRWALHRLRKLHRHHNPEYYPDPLEDGDA